MTLATVITNRLPPHVTSAIRYVRYHRRYRWPADASDGLPEGTRRLA